MKTSTSMHSQLSLIPLGAGDLIDRAVRFYRNNFWTFVLIASPTVVTGTIFLVGWTVIARNLFSVSTSNNVDATFYQIFMWFGNILIWLVQTIATLVIMGGASRNFVRHLLHGEPITFRETYRNVKSRLVGLIGVSTFISIVLGVFGVFTIYLGITVAAIGVLLVAAVAQSIPIVAFLVSLVLAIAVIFGTLWLFFLVVSRFVYIPQIMLVEGQSAFSAMSRSMNLAGKNVGRVAMLFIFTFVATYSALAILYVPVGWFAVIEGVDLFSIDAADSIPAWYQVANQVISQVSLILLTPVWMIGLCLLYVDERVRKEGYDVELLAAKRLGDIPSVPQEYINPLQPALSEKIAFDGSQQTPDAKTNKATNSTLGLE